MKITVKSSKAVKPAYARSLGGGDNLSGAVEVVPLSVFDKVNYDQYISGINFFRPPAQPNAAVLEAGLARALAEYRQWAGRLGVDADGNRAIILNDAGARFEATADVALSTLMPLEPSSEMLKLYPVGSEELMLVQVTTFAWRSVAVGHTMHHIVADGRATSSVLLAWGQATRGVPVVPVPVHDRVSFFVPRRPPRVEFQHRGGEFKPLGEIKKAAAGDGDTVVVHRARFSRELVSELKARASPSSRPCSTVQCLAAHLWLCVTAARGLDGDAVTRLRVAVDGRARMRVPAGYAGNAVLWAWPAATVRDLVGRPLRHAVELVRRAVILQVVRRLRQLRRGGGGGAGAGGRSGGGGAVPGHGGGQPPARPVLRTGLRRRPVVVRHARLPAGRGISLHRASVSGDSSVDAYVPLMSRCVEKCCYSMPVLEAGLEARL